MRYDTVTVPPASISEQVQILMNVPMSAEDGWCLLVPVVLSRGGCVFGRDESSICSNSVGKVAVHTICHVVIAESHILTLHCVLHCVKVFSEVKEFEAIGLPSYNSFMREGDTWTPLVKQVKPLDVVVQHQFT